MPRKNLKFSMEQNLPAIYDNMEFDEYYFTSLMNWFKKSYFLEQSSYKRNVNPS